MKRLLLLSLVSSGVIAGSFVDQAMVLDVNPRYISQQVPKQVCSMVSTPVQVTYPGRVVRQKSNTGQALLNTAIGAAIGHQFGAGKGKDAATVVGGLIGYGMTSPNNVYGNSTTVTEYRQVEQCNTIYETRQIQDGYMVRYNYNNNIGTMFSSVYPGTMIDVTVNIGD